MDYSLLSDEDLVHISTGNFGGMSDDALQLIANQGQRQKVVDYGDETSRLMARKGQAKTTWGEDLKGGVARTGKVLGSAAFLPVMAGAAIADYALGNEDQELFGQVAEGYNNMHSQFDQEDPTRGKDQGAGVIASAIPTMLSFLTPAGIVGNLAGTIGSATDAIQEGATPMQAGNIMAGDVGLQAVAVGLPVVTGATKLRGAVLGAGANVAQENVSRNLQSGLREDYGLKPLPEMSGWDQAAAALPGAAFGAALSGKKQTTQPTKGSTVKPTDPKTMINSEVVDLMRGTENLSKDIERNKDILGKVQTSTERILRQIEALEKLGDPKKQIPGLQAVLKKNEVTVENLNKSIEDKENFRLQNEDRINSLLEAGAVLPHEARVQDPTKLVETDLATKYENDDIQEKGILPDEDTLSRIDGLDLEISSLERFLATKQGTKAVRADAEEQLNSLRAERDALARPPEIPETGTPFADTMEQPSQRDPFVAGRDRYQVGDKFHAKEAEFVTYSPEVLKNMWDNKVDKLLTIQDPELRAMIMEEKAAIENAYGIVTKGELIQKQTPETGMRFTEDSLVYDDAILIKKPDGTIKSAVELTTEAVQRTRDPWIKPILEQMLKSPHLLDQITNRSNKKYLDSKEYAAAFNQTDMSAIFGRYANALTIAHEYIHGAVNDAFVRFELAPSQLDFKTRQAIASIKKSFERVKAKKELFSDYYKKAGALDDPREFAAYLSDKAFAAQVTKILNDRNIVQKVWDKLVDIAAPILGLPPKDLRIIGKVMQNIDTLIKTNKGWITEKEAMDAYNKIIKRDGTVTASQNKVQTILELSEPKDPLLMLDYLRKRGESPISDTNNVWKDWMTDQVSFILDTKDSPLVRNTFAVVKRGEEIYEEGKRFMLDGLSNNKDRIFGVFRNLTDTKREDALSKVLERVTFKDKDAVYDVIMDAARAGIDYDKAPGFTRLTKRQQELVVASKAMMDRVFKFETDFSVKNGGKGPKYRAGLIPHIRTGDPYVILSLPGVGASFPYYQRFNTVAERAEFIKLVTADGQYTVQETGSYREMSERQRAEEQRIYEDTLREAVVSGKVDTELLNQLRLRAMDTRFFGGHHKHQTSAEGFMGARWFKTREQNVNDFFDSYAHYADEMARLARNTYIRKQTDTYLSDKIINDLKLDGDPEIGAAKQVLDYVLPETEHSKIKESIDATAAKIWSVPVTKLSGRQDTGLYPDKSVFDRTNGVASTAFNYNAMMTRPSFHIAQAMSWTAQVPQYMSLQFGDSIPQQTAYMLRGIKRSADMRKGTEFDNLIEKLKMHHSLRPSTVNDLTQIRVNFDNLLARKYVGGGAAWLSGKRFGEKADTFSRYMAISILYEKGKDLNLSGDKLFHFVADHVDGAMGLFQRDKKAKVITQTGPLGDMLSPVSNYVISQTNWTLVGIKKAITKGEFQPIITLALTNAVMAGTQSTQFIAEYEILRAMWNTGVDVLGFYDARLPSLARFIGRGISYTADKASEVIGESAGRVVDTTLRQGVLTGAAQGVSESLGGTSAPDLGAGLRYQAIGKSLLDPNKTLVDSMSAYSKIATDAAAIIGVVTGRDVTENNLRKAWAAPRATVIHDYLVGKYVLPPLKVAGGEAQLVGKGDEQLMLRTKADDVANALGTRTNAVANEMTARQYRKEEMVKQKETVLQALRNVYTHEIRKAAGQEPLGMKGMLPASWKRLQAVGRKYGIEDQLMNIVSNSYQNEELKRNIPSIIRDLESAQPQEFLNILESYSSTVREGIE